MLTLSQESVISTIRDDGEILSESGADKAVSHVSGPMSADAVQMGTST